MGRGIPKGDALKHVKSLSVLFKNGVHFLTLVSSDGKR